jgi:hypothetical protein
VQGFLVYATSDAPAPVSEASLLAIASTAVGGAFARGYNKKHAPEQ